ncbi:hypothetical protein LCGC14_2307590, partial [marine sediment metagenome]
MKNKGKATAGEAKIGHERDLVAVAAKAPSSYGDESLAALTAYSLY